MQTNVRIKFRGDFSLKMVDNPKKIEKILKKYLKIVDNG